MKQIRPIKKNWETKNRKENQGAGNNLEKSKENLEEVMKGRYVIIRFCPGCFCVLLTLGIIM